MFYFFFLSKIGQRVKKTTPPHALVPDGAFVGYTLNHVAAAVLFVPCIVVFFFCFFVRSASGMYSASNPKTCGFQLVFFSFLFSCVCVIVPKAASANVRQRTTFHLTLARLIFTTSEDMVPMFEAFMEPLLVVLRQLGAAPTFRQVPSACLFVCLCVTVFGRFCFVSVE